MITNLIYHHKTLNIITRHVYLCVSGIKAIDKVAGDGKKIIPLLLKIKWFNITLKVINSHLVSDWQVFIFYYYNLVVLLI